MHVQGKSSHSRSQWSDDDPAVVHRTVRFRFYQRHSDTQWAVENFYIGPACENHCGGHGDCLDQHCLCDPGFTGPSCYASSTLKVKQSTAQPDRPLNARTSAAHIKLSLCSQQASLKERFDWDGARGPQWQMLEGGSPCTDCRVLVEGTALYFNGAGARQAVTSDLDLRGAK